MPDEYIRYLANLTTQIATGPGRLPDGYGLAKITAYKCSNFFSTLTVILLGLAFLWSCTGGPSAETTKEKQRPPVAVTVAQVVQKDMPVEVGAVGSVEANATVQIKSRVNGQLLTVHFKEGQDVKEGDPLVTIDPAPYELALKEAQARLAKDQALAQKAQADLRRNTALADKAVVSRQDYEQLKAAADSAEATVRADRALADNLALMLSYCFIRAPITGRTGSLLINKGSLVKANDDNKYLVVINQIQPILVTFAVPEMYLGAINRALKEREMPVHAVIAESDQDNAIQGRVTFVDNMVDTSTGTIKIKATFPNLDRRLWPGQVVRVSMTLDVQKGAIVVPNPAVQNSQSGQYVFVLKANQTAEMRPVTVARLRSGEAVIAKGVVPGETVITDGQLMLVQGSKVAVKGPGNDKSAQQQSSK